MSSTIIKVTAGEPDATRTDPIFWISLDLDSPQVSPSVLANQTEYGAGPLLHAETPSPHSRTLAGGRRLRLCRP